jgi:hypothetical protein
MLKTKPSLIIVLVSAILLAIFFGYRHWHATDADAERADLLSLLPADASAAGFLDSQQLRASPFLARILARAPKPEVDSDYQQFVQQTGFDYERDLDRVAISLNRQGATPAVFAVAEGRFDRKKIEAYAGQYGSLKTADGKTLFAVPTNSAGRKAYFTFLRDDRVALANDSSYFFQRPPSGSASEWREHFARVAGTPIFVILRQDSISAAELAQAPGGFRSPQLATLLSQLQWISIGGKPEGPVLRVVIDGETVTESTAHQLKELLSGLVVLAQVGLNDVKTRQQLDPAVRQGYLDLLQSADIQQLDRGTSKSVRVVFDVTPKLLEVSAKASPAADPPVAATTESKPKKRK